MQKIKLEKKLENLFIKTKEYQEENSLGAHPFEYYYLLPKYIEKYNLKKGLEVGTALGLTALASVMGSKDFLLDTIEKHMSSIELARENISNFDLENNTKYISQINFIEGRMFDVLDTFDDNSGGDVVAAKDSGIINKKYDYIFLDAYISRLNEVVRLERYLEIRGIFIVSNIRGDMKKSHAAKQYLFNKDRFELLELAGDTIFVRKLN